VQTWLAEVVSIVRTPGGARGSVKKEQEAAKALVNQFLASDGQSHQQQVPAVHAVPGSIKDDNIVAPVAVVNAYPVI
jgi:hypothetical protein